MSEVNSTRQSTPIPLDKCRYIQARDHEDLDAIADYAEQMRQLAKFPPIEAVYDEREDVYWVWDGCHRCFAANEADVYMKIDAFVEEGSKARAEFLACTANLKQQSLRRTNKDKRRVVLMALENAIVKRKNWTNRQIADHCHVSPSLVDRLVNEKQAEEQVPNAETAGKQVLPFKGESSSAIEQDDMSDDQRQDRESTKQAENQSCLLKATEAGQEDTDTSKPDPDELAIEAWQERLMRRKSSAFAKMRNKLKDTAFRKQFQAWVDDLLR